MNALLYAMLHEIAVYDRFDSYPQYHAHMKKQFQWFLLSEALGQWMPELKQALRFEAPEGEPGTTWVEFPLPEVLSMLDREFISVDCSVLAPEQMEGRALYIDLDAFDAHNYGHIGYHGLRAYYLMRQALYANGPLESMASEKKVLLHACRMMFRKTCILPQEHWQREIRSYLINGYYPEELAEEFCGSLQLPKYITQRIERGNFNLHDTATAYRLDRVFSKECLAIRNEL